MINEDVHDDAGARRMLDILTDPEAEPERRGQAAIKKSMLGKLGRLSRPL